MMLLRLLLCCLFALPVAGQTDTTATPPLLDPHTESMYRVRPLWDGLGGLALVGIGTVGVDLVRKKDPISQETLDRLATEEVGRLNRWGLEQDALRRVESATVSDYFFNGSILLPFTLFVDKKFRKDWLDITIVYLQAHGLNSCTYGFSPIGPLFIDRYRPVAYYDELDYGERAVGNNKNSFFSGHVSTTATGTFFFAKVLSDYNPQWTGGQRALAFGLASLPPIYVSVQRVRALKHFPTDCVVGMGVGALWGILTPQIHKNWQRKHKSRLTLSGNYGGGAAVAGMTLTF